MNNHFDNFSNLLSSNFPFSNLETDNISNYNYNDDDDSFSPHLGKRALPSYLQNINTPPLKISNLCTPIFTNELNELNESINIKKQLENLYSTYNKIKNELDCMFLEQLNLQLPFPKDIYSKLHQKQSEINLQCIKCCEDLTELLNSVILNPCYLKKIYNYENDFNILIKTVTLYQEELTYYSSLSNISENEKLFCKLLIIKQPFPKPIKKSSNTFQISDSENDLIVKLIYAPKSMCYTISTTKAHVFYEDSKECNTIKLSNNEKELKNYSASFSNLQFLSGSRQKLVKLQFYVHVQLKNSIIKQVIKSEVSKPFIILTNENQWRYSECGIISTLFGIKDSISSTNFANILQLSYIRATRQSLSNPTRSLALHDINYILELKYFSKDNGLIKKINFEIFWDWFGESLSKIRHRKQLSKMWFEGDIVGFISIEKVNEILQNKERGTFIIRFSESVKGQLCISYKDIRIDNLGCTKFIVKHSIIKENEYDHIIDVIDNNKILNSYLPISPEFNIIDKEEAILDKKPKSELITKYTIPKKKSVQKECVEKIPSNTH